MRIRSKVALGASFLSVTTVGTLVVAGLATTATLVVTDPLAPKASADSLSRFDDCDALLRWYVDHAVDEVGPYGWNGPVTYAVAGEPMLAQARPGAASAPTTALSDSVDARATSTTGTNTQEADVDEPDVAKTDGRRVVRLVEGRVLVVSDVTGDQPHELGRLPLPVDLYGGELLLAGHHVLVSQPAAGWQGLVLRGPMDDRVMPSAHGTRILDVDLTDPAEPRVAHDDTYTGSLVSLRQYGDTVRVVTTSPGPQLPWVLPHRRRTGNLTEREATLRNRALVRASSIDQWLPSVVDNLTRSSSPLLGCADVYHPQGWSGAATTVVTTYDVTDPGHRQSVGVTAGGTVVYSSSDRLYVASSENRPRPVEPGKGDRFAPPFHPEDTTTALHAFALDGTDTRYLGSGHVDGSVRDRWSLDEHDGLLRVAWTRDDAGVVTDSNGETRQHSRNGITILSEHDGALVPTGRIGDLGIDENIQSVRWFDDFAVLVTFRQMDPLYTIDLTDPARPRELGHLEVPGYSGYLHPLGDGLLLGLGVDATSEGRSLGAQAAVFDIGNLADPTRLSHQRFGRESQLPALDDPRGFTWLPDRRTALTTVSTWATGGLSLVALHVGEDGTLVTRDLATDVDWGARTLPLAEGRVAVVDGRDLRVLDVE